MENCILSIVTVSYNAASSIENTILSVISQKKKCDNIEYLIIDGGSTDGTIDIIKKYENELSFWVSEPDHGIYDAMNKGAAKSKGIWLLYINADDCLLSIPFEHLNSEYNQKKYAGICGCIKTGQGKIIKSYYNWSIYTHNTLPHQAMFYNQNYKYAPYNLRYKVFADYAYNIGMYKSKQKVLCCNDIIAIHSLDGVSNNKKHTKELFDIIKNNGWMAFLCSIFYFKYKGAQLRLRKIFNDKY